MKWAGWGETLSLKDFYLQTLRQAAQMVTSEDGNLAAAGRKILEDAAERMAEAEVFRIGQANRREDKPGASDWTSEDIARNQRIRAAYLREKGERGTVKRLAVDFNLSTRAISEIVKNERISLKRTE